jgi:protein-L-isoaspartate(D-aspartate) O-methyltransferase
MEQRHFTWIGVFGGLALGLLLLVFPSPPGPYSQSGADPRFLNTARADWQRPYFTERRFDREQMVQSQMVLRSPAVRDAAVLEAMRRVPRHLFVSEHLQSVAYADRPLPIGHGQTISQPFIVAFMTEALQVEPGAKILEIGTGSGYQAAVLSELTLEVFTIEIIRSLGEEASQRLQRLGYRTVRVRVGDGYYGWPEEAPFDGIIVTCAAGHIPPPLLKQLRTGGRMVIPLGEVYEVQRLMLVTKDKSGTIQTRELLPVAFVPMTGAIRGKP